MRSLYRNALVAAIGVGMVGCEWQGSGDGGNSWNESSGVANFAGTYQASGGGFIVSLSTSTSSTNNINTSQQIGTGTGSLKFFQGALAHTPIVPGSVNVAWPGGSVADSNGKLTGSLTSTGAINYSTGFISLTADPAPTAGSAVTVLYSYLSTHQAGDVSGITTFNVQQQGTSIRIIDNNGKSYSGDLGPSRTGGGAAMSAAIDGDRITSEFSATGQSASGANVTLMGTFSARVSGTAATTGTGTTGGTASTIVFSDRQISGTWVEDNGHTANISGVAN